ncbi:MAG TPA: hypothetical protein VHA75_15885, partial [Rugosimonospora sp.]|nr:hypothetical protein [Rugosimonospora sp.]
HCWTDIYAARHRTDRRIGGFAERHVHVVHDPGVPDGGVRVHLEMADGTRRTLERSTAPGDARTPLTPAQLRAKLRDSLANVTSPERVDTLAARLAGSADEPSITGLLDDLAQEPA